LKQNVTEESSEYHGPKRSRNPERNECKREMTKQQRSFRKIAIFWPYNTTRQSRKDHNGGYDARAMRKR